ncbi:unnamed protein product [Porites evermanni]|uniref:Ribosomal protein L29 n=1 Tax=Porites evermanni TaxID=104178 RepID=A0ABN8Q3X6_9CNID|nr:unnamed protein product [Porites evermanni]
MLLERELRDIKLMAEQSLISALTGFHKRKLQIQEKKLKANAAFAARKQKHRILPFVTTYHPAVNNLKQTLMEQWSLIQNQPLLKTIYLKPPIISYKR